MTARRCRFGTSPRSSCNRPTIISDEVRDRPVAFPPGCARLSTTPRATGSSTPTRTIGIVALVRFAASVAAVPAGADQFLDDAGQPLGAPLAPAVEDRDVAAVGPTK